MQAPFRQLPLFARLAFIPAFYIVNLGVFYYLGSFIAHQFLGVEDPSKLMSGTLDNASDVYPFLFLQGLFSLGGFLLSAILFTKFETGTIGRSMHLDVAPKLSLVLLTAVAIVLAQPLIEFLVELSKGLSSSPALQPLRELEEKEAAFMQGLLNYTGLGRFVLTATVVALIPALSEEFFFRGLIMRTMLRGKTNVALAIIVSGLLFAIVHVQLSNFLAIWVLGCFLGYLYYISNSLWLPVIAHFINNFLTVLLKYLYSTGNISKDFAEASSPLWLTLIGTALFTLCIFMFYKWREKADFADTQEQPHIETPSYE